MMKSEFFARRKFFDAYGALPNQQAAGMPAETGWRNACEDAGLVDLRFHDTRHTFATRLRANGVHEWDIRDLLGHASVRMTSVYTYLTPANLRQAVGTLQNRAIFAPS